MLRKATYMLSKKRGIELNHFIVSYINNLYDNTIKILYFIHVEIMYTFVFSALLLYVRYKILMKYFHTQNPGILLAYLERIFHT